MKNPIQPLSKDAAGVLRFKKNQIVSDLLDAASREGFDLNRIAMLDYEDDDRQQFAQLIGYSLSGYGELSYVNKADYAMASAIASNPKASADKAHIKYLERELKAIRGAFRKPVATLFGIHPDDLRNG